MKPFAIALSIIYIFIIGSNAYTSSNLLSLKEQEESYLACKSLKSKAPYLKLNCENLSPRHIEELKTNENGVKILLNADTGTRKVNKSEEIKLKNLIKKLKNENVMRKY